MSFLSDPNMARAIISDHYAHPRNKVDTIPEGYETVHMDSESCVDDFHVYLKINKDSNIVEDCVYMGTGCTISTASLSIISEMVKGKDVEYSKQLIENYHHMLHRDGEYDEEILEELAVFENTYKQANRIKCACLGAEAIRKIIKDEK